MCCCVEKFSVAWNVVVFCVQWYSLAICAICIVLLGILHVVLGGEVLCCVVGCSVVWWGVVWLCVMLGGVHMYYILFD